MCVEFFSCLIESELIYIAPVSEDRKLIRIVLLKSGREASNCWPSLLEGMYQCNPLVFNEMEKKLTLERFQREVSL